MINLSDAYLVEPVEPWVDLGEGPGVVEDLRRPVVGEVHQGLPGRRGRVQVDGSVEPAPDTQKGKSFNSQSHLNFHIRSSL